MSNPVRVALIGCGTIAVNAHLPGWETLKDRAVITHVCDVVPERAREIAQTLGAKAVTDYRQLVDDPDIDAVDICTPNRTHCEMALAFLHAGKDVFCEKPAARILHEAQAMQQAQAQTGRLLQIGVCNRYNTAVNKIKALIDAGELGEVYHVYLSFRSHRSIPGLGGAFTTRDIAGGGALIDWGVHFLDLAMYCTGDPAPRTVSGETFCKLGNPIGEYAYVDMWAGPPVPDGVHDVEESVSAVVRTDGPLLTVHGAWAQNIGEKEMYVDFMGTRAGIRLQYGKSFTLYSTRGGDLCTTQFDFQTQDMYAAELAAFLDTIATRQKNRANIDNAVVTSAIMQGIYDSAQAHREMVM